MPDVEVDRSLPKIVGFSVVAVALALWFGYAFRAAAKGAGGGALLVAFIAAGLWMAVAVLHPYVIKSAKVGALVFFAECAALLIPLFGGASYLVLGAVAPLFLFLLVGFSVGRREIANALRIKFFGHGSRIMSVFITGMSLFLAFYLVLGLSQSEMVLTKNQLRFLLTGSGPIMARYIPGFSLDKTVGETAELFVASKLPPSTPRAAIRQAADGLLQEIRKSVKANVDPDVPLLDALANISSEKFKAFSETAKIAILFGIGFLIFVTVKGLAFLVNWPILLVSFAIYGVLRATKFMHLEFEPQNKEIIVVK